MNHAVNRNYSQIPYDASYNILAVSTQVIASVMYTPINRNKLSQLLHANASGLMQHN